MPAADPWDPATIEVERSIQLVVEARDYDQVGKSYLRSNDGGEELDAVAAGDRFEVQSDEADVEESVRCEWRCELPRAVGFVECVHEPGGAE
jgi:hypothetical protein